MNGPGWEEERHILIAPAAAFLQLPWKGVRDLLENLGGCPIGTSWYLQVKANNPVEHIEKEEGHWENNS